MSTSQRHPVDPRLYDLEPGAPSEFHLDNFTIQRIFFDARNAYMAGLGVEDLWRQPVTPSLRHISVSFDASVPTTVPLSCVSRVVSRTSRSFTMEQVLSIAGDDVVVARCVAVQVTVSRAAIGAVSIPDELWHAIETLEQLAITGSEIS